MQTPTDEISFLPKINNLTKRFKTVDELSDFMEEHGGMKDCYAYRIMEDVTITPIDL